MPGQYDLEGFILSENGSSCSLSRSYDHRTTFTFLFSAAF